MESSELPFRLEIPENRYELVVVAGERAAVLAGSSGAAPEPEPGAHRAPAIKPTRRWQGGRLWPWAIVLIVLLFLTAPLAFMPEAVLSAVVFLIGVDLIDLAGMKKIYRERRSEFWVALITALMVVFVGVEQGIILAIVLSLIDHTRRGYRPKNALLQPAGSGTWHAQPVASRVEALPGLAVYRFTHSLYYANAQQFSEEILSLVHEAEPSLRWFCLDASAIGDVDFTAAETLRSLHGTMKTQGIRLSIAQVMEDIQEESRYDLRRLFGKDAFYDTLEAVVDDYRRRMEGKTV